jgi:hypothetical protein
MRQGIEALVVVLILATCAGLVVPGVVRVREASNQIQCQNNLHQLGIGVANYGDTNNHYPPAAMPNVGLPVESRISWLVDMLPYVEANDIYSRMDKKKGWDAEENRFAALVIFRTFHCPGYPERPPVSTLCPSHYVGIAGFGADSADLPSDDNRAGFFGYGRTLRKKDLARGESQTALATETSAAQGAWTAAGPATVRGFDPNTARFGGNHRARCQVVFADGSVRLISAKMSEAEWGRLVVLADEPAKE